LTSALMMNVFVDFCARRGWPRWFWIRWTLAAKHDNVLPWNRCQSCQ